MAIALPVPRRSPSPLAALATLAGRRLALTVRTPRELLVPLLTPILFATVIAPALGESVAGDDGSYAAFVAVATIGLLIPLNMMLSGIGTIVDRDLGARRELLAAPIPRPLLVLADLVVALAVTALQVAVLLAAAVARGIDFAPDAAGIAWFTAAAVLFGVGMHGIAATLANRVSTQEEYVGALPAIAIVPWFFAGSLFAIGALPVGLTWLAKLLPLTHALALMRYGLLGDGGAGLHDIWGLDDPTAMAALSLAMLAAFAAAATALAIRVFARSAVR